MYQFDSGIFRSNKAGGALTYILNKTADAWPDWLHYEGTSRPISGTPPGSSDAQFGFILTAADRDGEASSQKFSLVIGIACSAGLYRHFRLKISAPNRGTLYGASYARSGRFAICSVLWESSETTELQSSFPNVTAMATYNISGTTYLSQDSWSGTRDEEPITAFQQLQDAGCNVASNFDGRDAWLVSTSTFLQNVSQGVRNSNCNVAASPKPRPLKEWSKLPRSSPL